MRTLFFRIFISFWLAMAAIVTAAIAVTATVAWYRITMLSGIHPAEMLEAATTALRDQAAPGLRAWLAEVTRAHPDLDIYVVNDAGQDILGRPLPERIAQWLVLDGRSMRGMDGSRNGPYWPFGYDWAPGGITLSHGLGYNGSHLLANPRFAGPDGASYTLLVAWFGATPVDVLGSYNVALLLCLIALGASAVVCWWLARHISTPVAKLQAGAQTLASGRLDVQLDARICQRRDEFGFLAQEFNHMADRLRSHMASKEMLLRDISHELRSPLARLRVAISLAQRDDCHHGVHLERMEREIERLDSLIGQTLQWSRLSDTLPDFILETVDIDTLLRETVEDARMEADATGAQIHLSTNSASCMQGNPELLRRAVENVLRNAVRFAPAGSGIDVSCRTVHDGGVLVAVRDAGRGVPEPHLGRIFEAFYRVAEARSRDDGGTGLGLAITARIMILHGGHATARNHPDGGLVVELYFPGMAGQSGTAR